jgi:DNA replication protein DnaC
MEKAPRADDAADARGGRQAVCRLAPLTSQQGRDLLEIVDDRHGRGSTIVTSQLPVDHWHEVIVDPTIADAVLDRLVHTAHRLALDGETLRKPTEKAGKRSKLDTDDAE